MFNSIIMINSIMSIMDSIMSIMNNSIMSIMNTIMFIMNNNIRECIRYLPQPDAEPDDAVDDVELEVDGSCPN
jgi:hypothetical protein